LLQDGPAQGHPQIPPKEGEKMRKTLSVLAAFGFVLGMSGMVMAAGTATGAMTTTATLEDSCTVSAATMTFPAFAALGSTADQTADTNGSLLIACSTGAVPMIWSDSIRVLTGAGGTIAFNLDQAAGAVTNALPITTGAAEGITGYISTGAPIAVPLHGRIAAADFGGKAAGTYTADITVSVNY
jgi:spore coat protein U-like protein